MTHDHRRILATGIARLRAKIKYRPVVFELMPPSFTLGQLQYAVEALAGRRLHKQNFRRLIEQQDLVEETGAVATETGGRPAKLFRFRRDVVSRAGGRGQQAAARSGGSVSRRAAGERWVCCTPSRPSPLRGRGRLGARSCNTRQPC